MGANRAEAGPGGRGRYFNSLVAFRREAAGPAGHRRLRQAPPGAVRRVHAGWASSPPRSASAAWCTCPTTSPPGRRRSRCAAGACPPVQPLICYEALFPGFTREARARRACARPGSSTSPTTPGSAMTSGPLQHLNIASYRAIEEGLPIVRATPTGRLGGDRRLRPRRCRARAWAWAAWASSTHRLPPPCSRRRFRALATSRSGLMLAIVWLGGYRPIVFGDRE